MGPCQGGVCIEAAHPVAARRRPRETRGYARADGPTEDDEERPPPVGPAEEQLTIENFESEHAHTRCGDYCFCVRVWAYDVVVGCGVCKCG